MSQRLLANGINIKADREAFVVVDNIATVKQKRRFDHGAVNFLIIKIPV